jgi:hypothetical protein
MGALGDRDTGIFLWYIHREKQQPRSIFYIHIINKKNYQLKQHNQLYITTETYRTIRNTMFKEKQKKNEKTDDEIL